MAETKQDLIQRYKEEFTKWSNILSDYHKKFDNNYSLYTGENTTVGTKAKIADPVAYELTERVIQKLFEREPKFYVESKGKNLPSSVKNVMSAVADYIWTNQDLVQTTGSMRSKLKTLGRELCITGNSAVETYWNAKADAPDMRIIPIEDIIFNPAKNLKTSNVYYISQFVSLKYLKDNVELKKDGKVVTGIFNSASIKKLEKLIKNNENEIKTDMSQEINRSGGDFEKDTEKFRLISRWDGNKCCRFIMDDNVEDPIIIQEFENEVLGTNPINTVMDTEVCKEPFSQSFIDELKGQFKLKNLFLNQMADYGSKVLNPPTIVNPVVGAANLKTIANMYKLGGIVVADPNMIDQKPIAPIGNFGMDMLNWIEGRAESVSGIGAYLAGVPNQVSDKTAGTKGGIQTLVEQSFSPVKDRQLNIEESIIEPYINKALKMVGSTMADDEFKWVLISGEEPQWVKVTKGFLTGKIKLIDLLQAEVAEDNEIQALVDLLMSEGKDPEKDIIFDVDWLVKVESGSLAEQDSQKDIQNIEKAIEMAQLLGIQLDAEKLWKEAMARIGFKEPEVYIKEGGINGLQGATGNPGETLENPMGVGGVPNMAQGMPAGFGNN